MFYVTEINCSYNVIIETIDLFSNKNEYFSLFLNIKNNIYEILHIDIMLKLKDYLSTEKDSINTVKEARTKKWPDNEKDLNKEPEIKNAVDAEDVNVEKVGIKDN